MEQNEEDDSIYTSNYSIYFKTDKLALSFKKTEKKCSKLIYCCDFLEKLQNEKKTKPEWMTSENFSKFLEFVFSFTKEEVLESFLSKNLLEMGLFLQFLDFFRLEKLYLKVILELVTPSALSSYLVLASIFHQETQSKPVYELHWSFIYAFIKCKQELLFRVENVQYLRFILNQNNIKRKDPHFYSFLNDILPNSALFKNAKKCGLFCKKVLGNQDSYECLQMTNRMKTPIRDEGLSLTTWKVERLEFETKRKVRSPSFLMGEHFFHFQITRMKHWYSVCLVYEEKKATLSKESLSLKEGGTFETKTKEGISFGESREVLSFLGKLRIAGQIVIHDFGFSFVNKPGYSITLAQIPIGSISGGLVPFVFVNLKFLQNPIHAFILSSLARLFIKALTPRNWGFFRLNQFDLKVLLFLVQESGALTKKNQEALEWLLVRYRKNTHPLALEEVRCFIGRQSIKLKKKERTQRKSEERKKQKKTQRSSTNSTK